ncbi:MAG TPA: hypothetical protein VGE52_16440 [Pirellulales bacterium]
MRNRSPRHLPFPRPTPAPRWLVAVAVWFAVSIGSGATCVKQINHRPLAAGASLAEAIAVIEQQHTGIRSLKAFDSQVAVAVNGFPVPSLSARVAAVPELKLRIVAQTGFTGEEVDIGSNDDHFWMWVRRNEPPGVYWCRHSEFAQSELRRHFPIDPSWMMECLGLAAFQPSDKHLSMQPAGGGRLAIRSVRNTAIGPLQKYTWVDEVMGWVVEQHLYTADGKIIASARGSQHQVDPYTGAVTPRKIEMRWPSMKLDLKLTLGGVELNQLDEQGTTLWEMPQTPDAPPTHLMQMFRQQ